MKVQVQRFSPHQNGKVSAVLMAVTSVVFVLPFMVFANLIAPKSSGFPTFMLLVFPIMYLVLGYLSVALGCWVYNLLVKFTGGIEFESSNVVG